MGERERAGSVMSGTKSAAEETTAELAPVTVGAGELRGSLRRVQWTGRQDGADPADDGTDTIRPQLGREVRMRSGAVLAGVLVLACVMMWALASSHSG
jgi:hypothetical protein